jgi:hypothetical protein
MLDLRLNLFDHLAEVRNIPTEVFEILLYRETKEAKGSSHEPMVNLSCMGAVHYIYILQNNIDEPSNDHRSTANQLIENLLSERPNDYRIYKIVRKLFTILEAILIQLKFVDNSMLEHRFINEMILIKQFDLRVFG